MRINYPGKGDMNDLELQRYSRRLAEEVRAACLRAAQEAYESAGISGLCTEGRWECLRDAIRALDLNVVLATISAEDAARDS